MNGVPFAAKMMYPFVQKKNVEVAPGIKLNSRKVFLLAASIRKDAPPVAREKIQAFCVKFLEKQPAYNNLLENDKKEYLASVVSCMNNNLSNASVSFSKNSDGIGYLWSNLIVMGAGLALVILGNKYANHAHDALKGISVGISSILAGAMLFWKGFMADSGEDRMLGFVYNLANAPIEKLKGIVRDSKYLKSVNEALLANKENFAVHLTAEK